MNVCACTHLCAWHGAPLHASSSRQVQPTVSHPCCRCCWATRTCSVGQRRIWCGRASTSSWTRSRTATGPQSWEPSLRERMSWCTGATEPQVDTRTRAVMFRWVKSGLFLYECIHLLMQVWRISLRKHIWSIRSLSIWTRVSAVESLCGRKGSWRKDLGFVMELQAALMSSSCFIASQETQNTSIVLKGKEQILLFSTGLQTVGC